MKNIKLLDCTLRDGGRIFNLSYADEDIKDIIHRLANANIDIIEVGFLRDWRNVQWNGNSTFFTKPSQISSYLGTKKDNTQYVAFIDYGMFDFDTLEQYDGSSIDGIRVGFTKKDYINHLDDIKRCLHIVKERGYSLFVQGVNSLNYSDKELLELVEIINELKPYSFGIVDTYGAMYTDDIDRIFALVNNNMDEDICIDFHSHNNYQLSFSLAQEVIKLGRFSNRTIIIDATLNGMGKVAGNLNLELIVQYLIKKLHYAYDFDAILDLIDDHIYTYSLKYNWGYSIPAMMAGIYKSHPNNIIYLTEKFRLQSKDIRSIVSMIDTDTRQRYDYNNIDRIYTEYNAAKIDDSSSLEVLRSTFNGRKILVLAPGDSLHQYEALVDEYIVQNNPIIIAVNYVPKHKDAYIFFGNKKRYIRERDKLANAKLIISSNIEAQNNDTLLINYYSLINRGYKYFDNSTIMLLNLLKKLPITDIAIAGFDGFDENKSNNYYDTSFQNERHKNEFATLNAEIKQMIKELKATLEPEIKVSFITPSIYATKNARGGYNSIV